MEQNKKSFKLLATFSEEANNFIIKTINGVWRLLQIKEKNGKAKTRTKTCCTVFFQFENTFHLLKTTKKYFIRFKSDLKVILSNFCLWNITTEHSARRLYVKRLLLWTLNRLYYPVDGCTQPKLQLTDTKRIWTVSEDKKLHMCWVKLY